MHIRNPRERPGILAMRLRKLLLRTLSVLWNASLSMRRLHSSIQLLQNIIHSQLTIELNDDKNVHENKLRATTLNLAQCNKYRNMGNNRYRILCKDGISVFISHFFLKNILPPTEVITQLKYTRYKDRFNFDVIFVLQISKATRLVTDEQVEY